MAQPMFSTVLSPAAYGVVDNVTTVTLALGITTLVLASCTSSVAFLGMAAVGGNVDGMVFVFQNIGNNGNAFSFAHEDVGATAANRFRCAGLNIVTGGSGAGTCWFRYNAALLRWIHIAKT